MREQLTQFRGIPVFESFTDLLWLFRYFIKKKHAIVYWKKITPSFTKIITSAAIVLKVFS